ncbi:MAG: hypothetical protein U0792_08170 [Gemmataceae bacterium]
MEGHLFPIEIARLAMKNNTPPNHLNPEFANVAAVPVSDLRSQLRQELIVIAQTGQVGGRQEIPPARASEPLVP